MAAPKTKLNVQQYEHHVYIHYVHDDPVEKILSHILKTLNTMANEIEDLTAEVTETKGIMASAKVLIEGFAAALAKAGTDPVKLKALKDDLNAGSEELAAGIAANPLPVDPE